MGPTPSPSASTWRDRVLSEVEVTASKRPSSRRGPQVSRLTIEIPPGALLGLLREASTRRGCSPTGYIRRAMLAYLAYDLGLPFSAVVKTDPRFSPPNSVHPIMDPEGVLGGPWEIPR